MQDRLKLRQLNCFVAVSEELNFRRAADRLAMTQPPLSRQIRALEDTLNERLFDRDRSGVRLTDAGRAFLPDARALLRDARRAVLNVGPERAQPPVRLALGITTSIDVGLFSWIERAFAERFAPLEVVVKRQISTHSIRDLDLGSIELAVIGLPARADGLAVDALFDDPMVVCLPSAHPLARRRCLSLPDLQDEPLFWFRRALNPSFHDYCERVFKSIGYAPRRIPEPPDHAMLLGLIAGGQGVALIPKSLTSVRRQGVVFRPLRQDSPLSIRVALAYRETHASPALAGLVAMIKSHFAPGA